LVTRHLRASQFVAIALPARQRSSLSRYVGLALTAAAVACSWLAFSHLKLLIDPVYPSLTALGTCMA
jgi:hypothetical protein